MLNVVIITSGFAVDENDLVCVPFLQLYIQNLVKENVKVTIIASQYPSSKNYTWHGIEVITLVKKELKLVSKLSFKYRLNKALNEIHKQNKIDSIHHIWFDESVYPSARFAQKHHIKHITTFAGQDVLPQNKALRKINSYSGNLVCVSSFQQLKFKEYYPNVSNIIHWGVEDITASNQLKSIDLISCGWTNSIKNHTQFIDIAYELAKRHQIKKAIICGGGEKFNALSKKISELKLEHIVELKGSLPRPAVIELMKQSKFLIHTSTYEGFGLVLAEGLACGCKVISTPVGIAYNNNLITTCNTTEEFVHEINKENGQSENTIKPINQYPIIETIKNYLALYK